jgi:LysR family transcriptional regulator, carnitine catabolism transcriptional activator
MTQTDWYRTLSRINLNQLSTFLVVAEEKSFRSAAIRMHLSQSAVSVQVQQLERVLGLALFHRTTRSVALTREGSALADVAQRVTADLAEVTSALRAQAQLQKGLVTVVAMPTFAYMLLPQLMCRYAELHPNVEVRLLDFDSPKALEMLQSGKADLAVLARTPDMEGFDFTHLFEDELVVLAPAASPLLEGRSEVSVEEVAREQLVLSPTGSQTRALVEQIFAQAQCPLQVRQECQRPQTLLALVENGLGISILPRTALVDMNLSQVRLARLQTRPMREVGIVSLRAMSLSPAAQSFREFLALARPQAADDQSLTLGVSATPAP